MVHCAPLATNDGRWDRFNIVWSRAYEVYAAILEIAVRTNVIIYDPQVPEVILPPELT